jgi:hypothetical protein
MREARDGCPRSGDEWERAATRARRADPELVRLWMAGCDACDREACGSTSPTVHGLLPSKKQDYPRGPCWGRSSPTPASRYGRATSLANTGWWRWRRSCLRCRARHVRLAILESDRPLAGTEHVVSMVRRTRRGIGGLGLSVKLRGRPSVAAALTMRHPLRRHLMPFDVRIPRRCDRIPSLTQASGRLHQRPYARMTTLRHDPGHRRDIHREDQGY